jgi:hypothetical protein
VRFIVHIGMMKTGSTALQSTFAANRDQLAALGVCYPRAHCQVGNKHVDAVWSCLAASGLGPRIREQYSGSKPVEIAEAIINEARRLACSTVVVSAEDFSRYPAETFTDFIGALDDVSVVLFLRDQVEALPSMYAQLVKHKGIRDSLDDYLRGMLEQHKSGVWKRGQVTFDYQRLISGWSSLAGEDAIRVAVYDQEARSDIVSTFLELSGLEDLANGGGDADSGGPFIASGDRSNPSLSGPFLQLALRVNRLIAEPDRTALIRGIVRAQSDSGWRAQPTTLDPECRQEIRSTFRSSNEWVARRYFARGALFEGQRKDVASSIAAAETDMPRNG